MNKFIPTDWFVIVVTSFSITQCIIIGDFIMSIILYWLWDYYCFARSNYKVK